MDERPERPKRIPPWEPDPVIEFYKKDIDRTLLRENLKLTVTERFQKHAALQKFAEEMRRAGAENRAKDGGSQPTCTKNGE